MKNKKVIELENFLKSFCVNRYGFQFLEFIKNKKKTA